MNLRSSYSIINRTCPDGRVRLYGISSWKKLKNMSVFRKFHRFFDVFVPRFSTDTKTVGKSNLQNEGRLTFEVGNTDTSAKHVELETVPLVSCHPSWITPRYQVYIALVLENAPSVGR